MGTANQVLSVTDKNLNNPEPKTYPTSASNKEPKEEVNPTSEGYTTSEPNVYPAGSTEEKT